MNEFELSIDAYTKLIKLEPKYGNWYGFRGIVQTRIGKFNEALADLDKVECEKSC